MLSPRALSPLALALLTAVGGCHTVEIEPHTAAGPPIPAPDATPASRPSAPANAGVPLDMQPHAGARRADPTISLERVEGADLARTRTVFASVPAKVKACAPGSTGAVVVRVTHDDDHTKLSVESPGTLDREGWHCVLGNLSAVDYDGVLQQGTPSNRPSGFSALLRIEW